MRNEWLEQRRTRQGEQVTPIRLPARRFPTQRLDNTLDLGELDVAHAIGQLLVRENDPFLLVREDVCLHG